MAQMSYIWGADRKRRKKIQEIFPSKDDGKDGKGQRHASQTDGRDN